MYSFFKIPKLVPFVSLIYRRLKINNNFLLHINQLVISRQFIKKEINLFNNVYILTD